MLPPDKPNPPFTLGGLLNTLIQTPSQSSHLSSFLTPPQKSTTSPKKDLESPLSKKWNRSYYLSVKHQLANRTKQHLQRIRTITNGLTMPEITTIPLGSAKKMTAAILFFDLQNFTEITSKLLKEEVLFILRTYP